MESKRFEPVVKTVKKGPSTRNWTADWCVRNVQQNYGWPDTSHYLNFFRRYCYASNNLVFCCCLAQILLLLLFNHMMYTVIHMML